MLDIGGFAYGAAIGSVEAYDPFLNDWNFYPNLQTVRYAHTATVLLNGKVLVTGGYNADRGSSCGLFGPQMKMGAYVVNLNVARGFPTGTLPLGGRGLGTGGFWTNRRDGRPGVI